MVYWAANVSTDYGNHIVTCLKAAFIAVAGDDAHSRPVDTGADESGHVVVAQVFNLKSEASS